MKVIVATDGSKYFQDCLRFLQAIPQSKSWNYKIVSVQLNVLVGMYDEMTHAMWAESELKRAKMALDQAQEAMASNGYRAEGSLEIGHAGDAIVAAAQEWGADLCIVAARGHSALDRMLLGSTSDFVATHAPCSVLVVRPDEARTEADFSILVPFDESEASKNVIRYLNAGFAPESSKIELLHIIERPVLLDATIPYAKDWVEKSYSRMEIEKQNLKKDLADGTTIQVIEANHVAESICKHAETMDTKLIAIGERGRTTIGRMFLGSNSRYVLRHAAGSVLLVR